MTQVLPQIKRSSAQRIRLANGITLITVENPTVDIVAARLYFPAGSRRERPEQAGLSHLVAAVLTKGTKTHDSMALASEIESMGAGLGVDSTADHFEVNLKCISADFGRLLGLASEVLRTPTFPAEEVERERMMTLQTIRAQQERPFTLAFEQLRQALYRGHPYALPTLGTLATVFPLTPEDCIAFHHQFFRSDQMVMAVVGPLSTAVVQRYVEDILGDWHSPPTPLSLPAEPLANLRDPVLLKTVQETQQTLVMVGYLGAEAHSPDYPPLRLMTTYLGNGLSSRLFVELREKQGLAYEVAAFHATRRDRAPLVAYLGTAPENAVIALEGLRHELDWIQTHPLTLEALETTKRKLLGQYALGKQTNGQIAQVLGGFEILGLGMEFDQTYPQSILAVTLEQLQETAQRYLSTPAVSLVGPGASLSSVE